MPFWISNLSRHLARLSLTAILGGVLCAALIRNTPGFDADERLLDPRLDDASREAIRASHSDDDQVFAHYVRQVAGMFHGEFGVSPSLNRPIRELILARVPVTAELIGFGVLIAWGLALGTAVASVLWREPAFGMFAGAASTCSSCLPSAVVAILLFRFGGPVRLVIPFVLFPRLYETVRNVLQNAYSLPHIMTARAKGVDPWRILLGHALPVCAPELLALGALSVLMAFGISIPVETLCDLPGLGQLAWHAASARDLPLLVTLTLLVAILTHTVNAACDLAASGLERTAA